MHIQLILRLVRKYRFNPTFVTLENSPSKIDFEGEHNIELCKKVYLLFLWGPGV